MSKNVNPILPIRFRVNINNLKQQKVSVFNLPWLVDLKQAFDYLYEKEGNRKPHQEKPPYTTLNAAIASFSPVIAHGFIKTGWDFNNMVDKRQMMGLEKVPSEKLIEEIFRAWADKWINFRFSDLGQNHRDYAIKIITDSFAKPHTGWKEMSVYDAFNSDEQIKFRAVPSLLASMLAGKTSLVNNTEVKWGLSLYDDQLLAVSNPQLSNRITEDGGTIHGTFAYSIKFTLQTQAGDDTPWIHAEIRCQRYMDNPVKRLNYGRAASMLVQMTQTRKEGWPYNETLIQLPIYGGCKNSRYSDYLPDILEYLNARPLEDPKVILADPVKFRSDEGLDKYFLVYAEGYRPKHDLKSGFSPTEKADVVKAVLDIFDGILEPGSQLPRDLRTSRPNPLPLLNWTSLQKRNINSLRGVPNEQRNAVKSESQMSFRFDALKRALKGKKARVLILYSNNQTREALEWAIKRTFVVDEADNLPEWIRIQPEPIKDDLLEPVCKHTKGTEELNQPGLSYRDKEKRKKDFAKDLKLETSRKIDAWIAFLDTTTSPVSDDEVVFVLAELLELPEGYDERQSIHHVIRAACVKRGFASQMITPVSVILSDIKRVDKGKLFSGKAVEDRSRILSAIRDLLVRQSGLVGDGLAEQVYKVAANLPDSIANDLTVIGLYRRHTNGRNGIDFPMAVKLNPDGTCQAKIPGSNWMDYIDCSILIGKIFLSQKSYRLNQDELSGFVNDVITDAENLVHNTLVFVIADNWRTRIWPGLANSKLKTNTFLLDKKDMPTQRPLTPAELPNVRIVRLRETGTLGETPQYICSNERWNQDSITAGNVRGGGGFIDNDHVDENALHYFSIGDLESIRDEDLDAYKSEDGGGNAYRMESIIEMLPIFYQPEDACAVDNDALPIHFRFCRLAHFLRHSPAWGGGNTNYPFPLHLAYTCIEDMLCLLGQYDGDDEE